MCTFDIFTPFSPEIRLLQRIHLGGSSVILVPNLSCQVDKNISVVFLKMAFTYLYHFENKLRLNENNYLWICLPYCNTGVSKRKSKCCYKIYLLEIHKILLDPVCWNTKSLILSFHHIFCPICGSLFLQTRDAAILSQILWYYMILLSVIK